MGSQQVPSRGGIVSLALATAYVDRGRIANAGAAVFEPDRSVRICPPDELPASGFTALYGRAPNSRVQR